jgi:UrcA family protein
MRRHSRIAPRIGIATLSTLTAISIVSAARVYAEDATFRFGDLDLTSEAGKAELARRIDMAVRQACPDQSVTGSRVPIREARAQCEADVRRQIETIIARRAARASKAG